MKTMIIIRAFFKFKDKGETQIIIVEDSFKKFM